MIADRLRRFGVLQKKEIIGPMTIDAWLERLAERHEALTQAIEPMQRAWESRWANIATALQHDAENIRSLARIAEIHERRLSQIEGLPE